MEDEVAALVSRQWLYINYANKYEYLGYRQWFWNVQGWL